MIICVKKCRRTHGVGYCTGIVVLCQLDKLRIAWWGFQMQTLFHITWIFETRCSPTFPTIIAGWWLRVSPPKQVVEQTVILLVTLDIMALITAMACVIRYRYHTQSICYTHGAMDTWMNEVCLLWDLNINTFLRLPLSHCKQCQVITNHVLTRINCTWME